MRLSSSVRCGVLVGLFLLLAAGCSAPPPVAASGKVTKGGSPPELSKAEYLRLIFNQEVRPGTNPTLLTVKVEPDGSFSIDKLPRGKYQVTIQKMDATTKRPIADEALAHQEIPLVVEVDGTKPVEIDLDRLNGS